MAPADKIEATHGTQTTGRRQEPASDDHASTVTASGSVPEKKAKPAGKKVETKPAVPAKETKTEAKQEKKEQKGKDKEASKYDPWKVLLYPHLTEKSMVMVEQQNKLAFVVQKSATKLDVQHAVEAGFGVTVLDVNIENTRKGLKKAYVRLSPKNPAGELATRLGMM